MATPCAHKISISALCDIIATKKRNFGLELDESTICCVKFHPQNSEVDIPPYAVRWRRSEVILRKFDDGEERFNLEVRADAVNKWRALGPNVIVAIIFFWSYYKAGSMQQSQACEQAAGAHPSLSCCKKWSMHASDNLSGLLQTGSSPTPCESCITFSALTEVTKKAWSRPMWMMWLIEHIAFLSQGWSAQWPSLLKWVNPQPSWPNAYRGVRVGEANNPGPPSENGSQASQWPFTPSSQSSSSQENGAAGPAAQENAGVSQDAPGPVPTALLPTQPEDAPQGPQR